MQSEAGAAGRAARCAPGGRAGDDVHGVAGPAADDPEHVQDRRRADAGGHPRRGPDGRHPRAVDLRRPQRRDGRAHDRVGRCSCAGSRAGGARLRAGRPRRDAPGPGPVPALLRRLPHLARDRQDRPARRRRPPRRWSTRTTSLAPPPPRPDARTRRCCAARRRTPTCSSRRARRPTRSTPPCPAIVAERHGRARGADRPRATTSSTTTAHPTPSA